jgi:hypothetical protein
MILGKKTKGWYFFWGDCNPIRFKERGTRDAKNVLIS